MNAAIKTAMLITVLILLLGTDVLLGSDGADGGSRHFPLCIWRMASGRGGGNLVGHYVSCGIRIHVANKIEFSLPNERSKVQMQGRRKQRNAGSGGRYQYGGVLLSLACLVSSSPRTAF